MPQEKMTAKDRQESCEVCIEDDALSDNEKSGIGGGVDEEDDGVDGVENRGAGGGGGKHSSSVDDHGWIEECDAFKGIFLQKKRLSTRTEARTESDDGTNRMPMHLPTFKPATGCIDSSDFVVRCFVARLRAGITVLKHGRARWSKSRYRILLFHPDKQSLSWAPADGEPPKSSSKRPPQLDLSSCTEVRHAWSPDPQNPMYTGTAVLRQKCEASNANKSFALIFPNRTVDITATTADQCKVLMEGFSALCFRLKLADHPGLHYDDDDDDDDDSSQ